jgi:hypothetical protein
MPAESLHVIVQIITDDEQDVGFFIGRRGVGNRSQSHDEQAENESIEYFLTGCN